MPERSWPHNFTNEQIGDRVRKSGAQEKESGIWYIYDRQEDDSTESIDDKHAQSFIQYIENRLADSQFKERKFRILDLGGGGGVYADQLKEVFGDKIEVFTTGLAKQPARDLRRERFEGGLVESSKLPHNYLKWRSIMELSHEDDDGRPKKEFDLIINTWGEFPYGFSANTDLFGKPDKKKRERWLRSFLGMVVAKLRVDGLASIFPVRMRDRDKFELIMKELEKVYNFQFEFLSKGHSSFHCLKIRKLNGDDGDSGIS